MAEAFRQVAAPRRDQEALVCETKRDSYGRLLTQVDALARGLEGLGVRKGERVVSLIGPSPDFVLLFFAAAQLGAVLVPLSPQVRPRRLQAVLDDAAPVALVAARSLDAVGLDAPPSLVHVIHSGQDLRELIDAGSDHPPLTAEVSPDDLLALLYTSGTTGEQKGTMHTHSSLIAPVVASLRLRDLWIRRPSVRQLGRSVKALARYRMRLLRAAGRPQTFLSTVGWHTITGLEVMLQGLLMGDRLVVMPRFHPREALALVEQERVTVLVAVPMALRAMLEVEAFDRYDTSSLLICGTGAAPCPPELAREMQQHFGCAVHIGFGATETAGGISATGLDDSAERQASTVGRPMPGMEVKVVDEQRRELPPGRVGELACRSQSLMRGYFRAPELTAQVMDEDGWYYSGDLAVIDEEGYLQIVGRKREVIIRGGQNVYPAEIEAFLCTHPGIREAAVVGMPSAVEGETVWAFVILQEGVPMTPREVAALCRSELETFQIPARVKIVTDFPRSETGKPQKHRLRDQALKEAHADEERRSP